MKVIQQILFSQKQMFYHNDYILFISGNVAHYKDLRLDLNDTVQFWYFNDGFLRGSFEGSFKQFAYLLTDHGFMPIDHGMAIDLFSPCYRSNGSRYTIGVQEAIPVNGIASYNGVHEINLENGSHRQLKEKCTTYMMCTTSKYHYAYTHDDKPQIIQYDHDLNIRMTITESQLREYGALALDDEYGRNRNKKCQVRNLQVFGDTLYYLYNFTSIIAVNVETGKYKGSFKYITEEDKMEVAGTSEQFDYKYAGRVLYDLHAGRYSRELHAHVGIYSYCYTDFIYEIDYNTLTAKARRVDVSSLWPGEELGSMQMIGQDRLAVYPKDRRSLAILDYHTLEILDSIVLDDEQPHGYHIETKYEGNLLYVLYRSLPRDRTAPKIYVVDISTTTSSQ